MPQPTAIGVRVSGVKEAQAYCGFIVHQIGVWSASQIGAVAQEPYSHWINEGFYYSGRPGRTRAVRFMQRAKAQIIPLIRAGVAESLAAGGPNATIVAKRLSDRLVSLAQGYATHKSGRLARGIRPLRGGRFFPV